MLWYKAWLETRSRFMVSLVGMVVLCSLIVFHLDGNALSWIKAEYYYGVLGAGHRTLVMMWVLAVTLLMMGGLLREKAIGSSALTLALPVSRTRLTTVRIGMGLIQTVSLAVVPWIAMFLIGWVFGKTHSISQAVYYLVILVTGGLPFFSMSVLASSLIEGEYTAPVVSFGAVLVTTVALSSPSLRPYSPLNFMMGFEHLNEHTNLLSWPIPWLQATIYILVAALLLIVSVKVIERREF